MLDALFNAIVSDIAFAAFRRRRERRERGRVLGCVRIQSGELSGVSARWREFNTQVAPGRLVSKRAEATVLGVRRRPTAPTMAEKLMFASLETDATILEVRRTATSVLEMAVPTGDVTWVTEGLGFPIEP